MRAIITINFQVLISMITALCLCVGSVSAKSLSSRYYHDTYDKDGVRLVIGAQNGRRFFLIMNYTSAPQNVTIYLGEDFQNAANDRSFQQYFLLEEFAVSELRYLDEIAGSPKFVSAWNLGVPEDKFAEPILQQKQTGHLTPDRDAQPLVRSPPNYPDKCMKKAEPIERVQVRFDVTEGGDVQNIAVVEATNDCFVEPTLQSVENWVYAPKFNGKGWSRRNGVETVMVYQLSDQIIRLP